MTIKTMLLAAVAGSAIFAAPAQAARGDGLVRLRGLDIDTTARLCPPLPGCRG